MTVIAALEPAHLDAVRELLPRALPFDVDAALVAEEKLFGANPPGRAGQGFVARDDSGRVVGVAALAGKWLKLLAVDPSANHHGVGSLMLEACEAAARASGQATLRTADHPGNYLSPGIDRRYHDGIELLTRHGFREVGDNRNLRVPLGGNPLVTRERADKLAAALAEKGYLHRPLTRAISDGEVPAHCGSEHRAVLAMVRADFSPVWAFEVERGLVAPGRVWVCWWAGVPVAFAAHDANNRGLGWFGPAGTLSDHRGKNIGELLLLECLLDIEARGRDHAVIAWIGPLRFYEKSAGARLDREFVVLEKPLT